MSLSDDEVAGLARRRRIRPLGRQNAGVDHLVEERSFEDVEAPPDVIATDPVDHLVEEASFVDLEAPPWPDDPDHLFEERSFEDLEAPAPIVSPSGETIEMQAWTSDVNAVPATPTRFYFRAPLRAGQIKASDIQTQFRIRAANGTELSHKAGPLLGDDGVMVPHHCSPRHPAGGYDPLTVTPLMLVGWVEVPVTGGVPETVFFDFYKGRTLTDLTGGSFPTQIGLAPNGAKMQKTGDDTAIELVQDIFHTSPIRDTPLRCSKNLLQYMPPGVSYVGTGGTQTFVLVWNNRTGTFSFDTLLDRFFPNAKLNNSAGDAGPPVETIARCKITIPAGKSWRPGVDTFASIGATVSNLGAAATAELGRAVPNTSGLDEGRTLLASFVIPAFSTPAKRAVSVRYLSSTRFLSGALGPDPVPVEERKTWGFPMSAPDEVWDHDKMLGFNFGRRDSHRVLCAVESNQATYNMGALAGERWLDTAHVFWYNYVAEACVGLDRTYGDPDGDEVGNVIVTEPRMVAWQFVVGYALSGRARFKKCATDITLWAYDAGTVGVHWRMLRTPNQESQSRRVDSFCLLGAAGLDWLGVALPPDAPATTLTRQKTTATSWKDVCQTTLRGFTNATLTDYTNLNPVLPSSPDYGKVEQVHSHGFTNTQNLPVYHWDGTEKSPGPKPYHTSMVNQGLVHVCTLAAPRWTAAERDAFLTDARAQIVRTELWSFNNMYFGSPLQGPDFPLGTAEGLLYTFEETIVRWGAGITDQQKLNTYKNPTTGAPTGSVLGGPFVVWDATQGRYVPVTNSDTDVMRSDGYKYEDRSPAPWTKVSGFLLTVLSYLVDTETDPARLVFWETYLLRAWKNARAHCTTPGGYTFGGINGFMPNGNSSPLAAAKIFPEAWAGLHRAAGNVARLRTKYPALAV